MNPFQLVFFALAVFAPLCASASDVFHFDVPEHSSRLDKFTITLSVWVDPASGTRQLGISQQEYSGDAPKGALQQRTVSEDAFQQANGTSLFKKVVDILFLRPAGDGSSPALENVALSYPENGGSSWGWYPFKITATENAGTFVAQDSSGQPFTSLMLTYTFGDIFGQSDVPTGIAQITPVP